MRDSVSIIKEIVDNGLIFYCPGCETKHTIYYQGSKESKIWNWNLSLEHPTISPSILVETTRLTKRGIEQCNEWVKNDYKPDRISFETEYLRCHSFIENGYIRFLVDCTHELANQTIPLPYF